MNTNTSARTVVVAAVVGLLAAAGGYGLAVWRGPGAATHDAASTALPAASAAAG